MKLVVFDDYRIGVLRDNSVHDVSALVPEWRPGDLYGMNRLIANWDALRAPVERSISGGPAKPLREVKLRAPNPGPMHLFMAGQNYRSHVEEMAKGGFPGVPTANGFNIKATGSICGPNDAIELPLKQLPNRRFDYEGEIAFVIGREARGVAPEEATDYIFGYTILVDVTLRGEPDRMEERPQRKSYATFSPMGPCITTTDEIPDCRTLSVKLWLNGEERQHARAEDMIVDIPNLLSQTSFVLPMQPGDVFTTGSPPGVGRLTPGDTLVVGSPSIGEMTLPVKARDW